MISLKVLKVSDSGKSAFCSAIKVDGAFESQLAAGNIIINKPLPVGSIHVTSFTKVSTRTSDIVKEGVIEGTCTWLVLE